MITVEIDDEKISEEELAKRPSSKRNTSNKMPEIVDLLKEDTDVNSFIDELEKRGCDFRVRTFGKAREEFASISMMDVRWHDLPCNAHAMFFGGKFKDIDIGLLYDEKKYGFALNELKEVKQIRADMEDTVDKFYSEYYVSRSDSMRFYVVNNGNGLFNLDVKNYTGSFLNSNSVTITFLNNAAYCNEVRDRMAQQAINNGAMAL